MDHLKVAYPQDFDLYKRLARHVEVRVAVDMLLSGDADHRVIVMDRPVCGRLARTPGRTYCDDLLDNLLTGTGKTLTVIEKDGQRVTYPKKDRR